MIKEIRNALETELATIFNTVNDDSDRIKNPSVFTFFESEENTDENTVSNDYTNRLSVRLRTKLDLPARGDFRAAEDIYLDKLVEIKSLFGGQTSMEDQGVNYFFYRGYQFIYDDGGSAITPSALDVVFELEYSQDRLNPNTRSC